MTMYVKALNLSYFVFSLKQSLYYARVTSKNHCVLMHSSHYHNIFNLSSPLYSNGSEPGSPAHRTTSRMAENII